MLLLYGHGVRAGVSIGMAIGALVGAIIGGGSGRTVGAVLVCALLGVLVGGLIALIPSLLGALLLVVMVGHGLNVRRDVTITIGIVAGVLDLLWIALAPAAVLFVAAANLVLWPMLWWARNSLTKTAEAVV